MLYDCLRKKGVKCQATAVLVEGRTILEWTGCAGTYGMGGPGFFGLLLERGVNRPKEWLICTLWDASDWMTVNGRWLSAHVRQYSEQKPLYGPRWVAADAPEEPWDEWSPLAVGQTLHRYRCEQHWCELVIGDSCLQITEDPTTRPIHYGSKEPRVLGPSDDLRKAWVLAKNPRIWI